MRTVCRPDQYGTQEYQTFKRIPTMSLIAMADMEIKNTISRDIYIRLKLNDGLAVSSGIESASSREIMNMNYLMQEQNEERMKGIETKNKTKRNKEEKQNLEKEKQELQNTIDRGVKHTENMDQQRQACFFRIYFPDYQKLSTIEKTIGIS